MAALDFHFFPGTCTRVSHIALEELGLAFSPRLVELPTGAHKQPDYLALNASGKVPTLVVDGTPLVETLAILQWLDAGRPGVIMPDRGGDAFARAQDWSLVDWFGATVHPVFTRFRMPPAAIGDPAQFGAVAAHAAPVLAGYFAQAAARLGDRDWLLDIVSAADFYLFWLWAEAGVGGFDGAAFPSLAAHHDRVAARPAVRRAMTAEGEAMADLARRGLLPPPPGAPAR